MQHPQPEDGNLQQVSAAVAAWYAAQAEGLAALRSLSDLLYILAKGQKADHADICSTIAKQAPSARLSLFLKGNAPVARETLTNASNALSALHRSRDAMRSALLRVQTFSAGFEKGAVKQLQFPHKSVGHLAITPEGSKTWDIALVQAEVAQDLTRQTNVLASITDVVALDTDTNKLATYTLVWETCPYINDDTIKLLQGLSS